MTIINTSWASRTLERAPLLHRTLGHWCLASYPHDARMPVTVIRF